MRLKENVLFIFLVSIYLFVDPDCAPFIWIFILRVYLKHDITYHDAGGGIRTHESLRNRVLGNAQRFLCPFFLSFAPFLIHLKKKRTCAVDRAWRPPRISSYLVDGPYIYLLLGLAEPLITCSLVE